MSQTNPSPTLDGLFRRILARQPDALALLDPLNKPRITGAPPKRLTDEMVRDQRIATLKKRDPVLGAAIDALDLELAD